MDDRLIFGDRYKVGIAAVDAEHQKLFDIAGTVYDCLARDVVAPMSEIRAAVAELVDYARTHFASEEAMMSAAGCPWLAEHHAMHEKLVSRVQDMETRAEIEDFYTPIDLYEFLCSWLIDHIEKEDTKFGQFLAQKSGGAAGGA